jgi:hypothetical protein
VAEQTSERLVFKKKWTFRKIGLKFAIEIEIADVDLVEVADAQTCLPHWAGRSSGIGIPPRPCRIFTARVRASTPTFSFLVDEYPCLCHLTGSENPVSSIHVMFRVAVGAGVGKG